MREREIQRERGDTERVFPQRDFAAFDANPGIYFFRSLKKKLF